MKQAQKEAGGKKNISYSTGDILNYAQEVSRGSQDLIMYNWNTILEAQGPGNTIKTLNNAWLSLKPDGLLVFDIPTRKNNDMQDGWYVKKINKQADYVAYIPEKDEIRFLLRITGFDGDNAQILHWKTKPSDMYPGGMYKISVVAKKQA